MFIVGWFVFKKKWEEDTKHSEAANWSLAKKTIHFADILEKLVNILNQNFKNNTFEVYL